MAPFLLILPLLASLRYLIQPIDCAIKGGSTEESDLIEPHAGPKVIKGVLAQTGGNALLPCQFNSPGIVTWIRRKDRQLLTLGRDTHSIDTRFVVANGPGWNLLIKNVKQEDAGLYECQIQTAPMQQRFVRLNITEAYSVIPGGPDLHVKQGTSLRLECQLMAAAEPPSYVFWYREARMINYDNEPGVRFELRENGSVLVVEKVKLSHGANYTCSPNNARPAHIMIHVIEEEEKPAAMHGGDRRNSTAATSSSTILILVALLIIADVRQCFQVLVCHAT
ncbi:PREDICTED: tyrosine-protein kinase-like otk [Vollenhovia emeryi]|uniref:tyrosine-protein kinase-like otk n=1 Tax=Vollenhovia emeryi TaxID=411798 RepID=UPI0005F3DDD1|nr:PREDICTED: tyrosine-protein kinase-like otk [Vollenhovia emeryi]XP_011874168.1 PREDICTED: tyrosine-protein kinase-like otk [Vollenhovia emeryi]XP_011874169.1 PREDICTED: tyrosine-protein kinase-like otk [Vollenhovia emeryi]XP_011874170.1 PREDICTED: tyrosine-protein kinase-like otk [Vollenhovia emeryi]